MIHAAMLRDPDHPPLVTPTPDQVVTICGAVPREDNLSWPGAYVPITCLHCKQLASLRGMLL